jgi:ribokinase
VITGIAVQSIEDAKKCAAALLQQGFRKVILTLGSRGALLASPEGSELVAPFVVTPVDTTGAGDAFIGSFAVFLGAGLPEKEAVTRANLYAAMSTMKVGTQKSFPTGAEFTAEWSKRAGKA